MKLLGIDIGTTSISAVVLDTASGQAVRTFTLPNDSALPADGGPHRLQDPERIWARVERIAGECAGEAERIGVTGQMHGILYLDGQGRAVSPLYTWQDEGGNRPFRDGGTFCERLCALTGHPLASGYGAVTHFYLQQNGLLPPDAVRLCTIGDYIALRLTGGASPVMHISNAASVGLYDPVRQGWDRAAMERAGIDPACFPPLESGFGRIGQTAAGIPVAVALGDNQASFLSSVQDPEREVLLNLGTGGQLSCYSETLVRGAGFEARPYLGTSYLLVASALCGGRAYAALERFFRAAARMVGAPAGPLYDAMQPYAARWRECPDPPEVVPAFCGTREDPSRTAAIAGLTLENFTPEHLIAGFMLGIARELRPAFQQFQRAGRFDRLTASGNTVRRNPAFQEVLSEVYGLPLRITRYPEEAACGACLYAEKMD